MNKKIIQYLIDLVNGNDLDSIEYRSLFTSIKIKKNAPHPPVSSMATHYSAPLVYEKETQKDEKETAESVDEKQQSDEVDESRYHVIHAPMSGIFYRSPSPDDPPFVSEKDQVKSGQVLCIIDAMKMMNEIESDQSGKIVKILAENGAEIEVGQPIFYLE